MVKTININGKSYEVELIISKSTDYKITYNNSQGTLTVSVYALQDIYTKEIVAIDYYQYTVRLGLTSMQDTVSTEEELNDVLKQFNAVEITDNNQYKDNPENDDYEQDNKSGSNVDDTSQGKGVFDDTMGNDFNHGRSQLPLGADIHDPKIINSDYKYEERESLDKQTMLADKGVVYPIIRINDHYFTEYEIQYFSCETGYYKNFYDYGRYKMPISGFIPTFKLIVVSSNPDLLKTNFVKNGDRCAVFFTSSHSMIKSIRCDFRITNVITNHMPQNINNRYVKYILTGELYVPDLRNEEIRYNFNGSSRDAMMDAAKRLRLSFFFCDPEDTDDVMVWCNCKTPELFIKDLTTHAWKNPNSFFESWIDPRYGLSFQNINKLLLEDGFDEPLDVTFWINTFINNRTIDGVSDDTNPTKPSKPTPQAKIFTNIPNDDEAATVYHVNKWRIINSAQEIQDYIGLNCKQQFEAVNPGLQNNPKYNVEFSLCLNKTKFNPHPSENEPPSPFYVFLGPGRNLTYQNADVEMKTSETESSNKKEPEKVTNPQSDGDGDLIKATDGNMLSSGNTHKFYEVAYEHNMRNLLQLQKQIIDIELNGANLTILRGEKMPLLLIDNNKAISFIQNGGINFDLNNDSDMALLSQFIYEAESGWYIIDGIEWVYNPEFNDEGTGTCWRTNVKLTRREWPVPGYNYRKLEQQTNEVNVIDIATGQSIKMAYQDYLQKVNNGEQLVIDNGNLNGKIIVNGKGKPGENTTHVELDENGEVVVYGENKRDTTINLPNVSDVVNNTPALTQDDIIQSDKIAELYTSTGKIQVNVGDILLDIADQYILNEDRVKNSTVPLTGLKAYMKELYRAISEASDGKVKLVSARRWAVDQNGNKVDGNAFIKKNGYYKCMNAFNNVMYFKNNNSKHLYGEAIDIINYGDMNFNDLMTKVIMRDKNILTIMYQNGVSAYIEQAKDDMGVTTKHYHLGTDTIKQREFWSSVKALLGSDLIPGTQIVFTNYMKYNNKTSQEITYSEIDEYDILGLNNVNDGLNIT